MSKPSARKKTIREKRKGDVIGIFHMLFKRLTLVVQLKYEHFTPVKKSVRNCYDG